MSSTEHSSSDPPAESPNSDATGVGPIDIRSVALSGIFVLMVLYTLNVAAPIMIPITLAFMLSMLLSPIVGWFTRARIPQSLAAGLVLSIALGTVGAALYLLAEPASEWAERAPQNLRELEFKLSKLKEPIEDVRKATEKVEELANLDDSPEKLSVEVGRKSILAVLFEGTPRMLAGLVVIIVLLYFLLASGDSFLRKLVTTIPRLHHKKRAVEIVRTIQRDVSLYLFTITVINLGLGVCTAIAMYWLNMPNPALWGAMVAIFNFAPYIGALFSLVILSVVGVITFDTLAQALVAPATFFALTLVEGQLITPTILGNRLSLSPVIIFVGILFWGWFWGILGALIAAPILVSLKLVCGNIEKLRPVAEFMGR